MILKTNKPSRANSTRVINGVTIEFDKDCCAEVPDSTDIESLIKWDPSISTLETMPTENLEKTRDQLIKRISSLKSDLEKVNDQIAHNEASTVGSIKLGDEPIGEMTSVGLEEDDDKAVDVIIANTVEKEAAPDAEEEEMEFDWNVKNSTSIIKFIKSKGEKVYPKKEWATMSGVIELRKYLNAKK